MAAESTLAHKHPEHSSSLEVERCKGREPASDPKSVTIKRETNRQTDCV